MEALRNRKESDNIIEAEARRRINAENKQKAKERREEKERLKKAREEAERLKKEEQERIQREKEEEQRKIKEYEKWIKITGIKARIKRLEYDIEHDVYTYKRIMAYREGAYPLKAAILDDILSDIKKTHDSNLGMLAAKSEFLRSME